MVNLPLILAEITQKHNDKNELLISRKATLKSPKYLLRPYIGSLVTESLSALIHSTQTLVQHCLH